MKCKHAKTKRAEIDIRDTKQNNNNNRKFKRATTKTSQNLIKINNSSGEKQLERFAQRQTEKKTISTKLNSKADKHKSELK